MQQIDGALHEAYGYDLVVFAGFAATAEAQQYVAGGKLGKFNVALLEVNPICWSATCSRARPPARHSGSSLRRTSSSTGTEMGTSRSRSLGVDIFDASTGETKFVGDEYIAAWFLDTDYDGLVFHVNQAFFPDGGW